MVMSVNTNVGAMIALQSLALTNKQLIQTQLRVTTGLRVNGPKDDAATFAIAQNMRGDIAGMGAVLTDLSLGESVVRLKQVAKTGDRADVFRAVRIVPQLLAQAADHHVHHSLPRCVSAAAKGIQEVISR